MKYDIRNLSFTDITVSPSILAADFGALQSSVNRIVSAGADLLHLDVMDGHFVPNISFGIPVISSIRAASPLPFDTHLMISHPAQFAAAFANAGADHITFHIESDDNPADTIAAIRASGCSVGISLKPATPADAIIPYLDQIDLILLMTVEPGFGGQSFMSPQLDKARRLRELIQRSGRNIHLEADGGIDPRTAPLCRAAGINMFVAGTAVFRAPDPAAAIKTLKNA